MRKIWTSFLAVILVVPLLLQTTAHANSAINVYIDGSPLKTDQAPIMVQGRVMLPLRAIFEALNATVKWDQKAQMVTAIKGDTTIVLKIKSKAATINNQAVTLDVPAQSIKGRTMVPVRFVSEALGQEVGWNSKTKRVTITSSDNSGGNGNVDNPSAVSYVTLRDNGSNGDGRDLEVSFGKSFNEASAVDHYRVYIVKAGNASWFNLSATGKVSTGNYSTLLPTGSDQSLRLLSSTRDVDGAVIKANQSYVAFVLAVGKGNATNALSAASGTVTLDSGASVAAATNVKASDVSDYGDGRDISVSFTRPQNDSNINNYRVLIVKTKDVSSFNLSTANNASSQSYIIVNKSGSNTSLKGTLNSNSRDTSGEIIKNGVAYTAYVLSVSNSSTESNKLSSGSSSFTLNASAISIPTITQVRDQSDNGDGRDLRISFTKLSDESKISGYRVFVVKASDYANFNLSKANLVSSSNYTAFNKKNYNFDESLSSSARDVDGVTIRTGVSYRVFVMAVGSGSYTGNNTLSSPSSAVTLSNNYSVGMVTNINVSDVYDNNDGRDLYVSYTRPSDESNISSYRILVVKTSNAGSFNLSKATAVSGYNYYTQASVGSNFNQALASGAKDVDGYKIQNGVSYTVFVLSVGKGSYNGTYTLSAKSSPITLSNNYTVGKATNITVNDISDHNDGRDLEVAFTRASDESNISNYRIMVVKASNAGSFDLAKANLVNSYNYTEVNKGSNYKQSLSYGARDVDGNAIQNGVNYRVFVLSVGTGSYAGNNALSLGSSSTITLSYNYNVLPVPYVAASDIGDNNDGRDLEVFFNKASDESSINHYRILVVKSANAGSFNLTKANAVNNSSNYTQVAKRGDNIKTALSSGARDVDGATIRNDVPYRVFVLSVGSGNNNALSQGSSEITLSMSNATEEVSGLSATLEGNTGSFSDIKVSFNKVANENKISEYRILIVPSSSIGNFRVQDANNVTVADNYTRVAPRGSNVSQSLQNSRDAYGNAINTDTTYQVLVLSVAKSGNPADNTLSRASNQVRVNPNPDTVSIPAVSDVKVTSDASGITVSFTEPAAKQNIAEYAVIAVPKGTALDLATARSAYSDGKALKVRDGAAQIVTQDVYGMPINNTKSEYDIYVLSVPNMINAKTPALSPSYSAGLYVPPVQPEVTPPASLPPVVTPPEQPSVPVAPQ
ncbi:hypothetical protein FHR92_000133 [Fontibacillus solani]|uniref:Copper amine oxidase-like N-terminal domain-containing protein n=1 Tax=Fontibacillus solani TaxID=1572857 RepID=A0A7W3XPR6_9BACL|nr:copper amine oxidase N-terminal domain-containing protein [Fontibacillus solani]MBA9083690.1 hypothetical protein [Fontibacillus solani]